MVITTIYVTRHGFRGNWTVDPDTGRYFTNVHSPTGIASDPPLAAYGVRQSEQLAVALTAIRDPPITYVYSSPFYRCLQTLQPFVEKSSLEVRGDNGLGEFYGLARFTHPAPATPSFLNGLFPSYNLNYKPSIIPSSSGETVAQLHERCAYALQYIIAGADADDAYTRKGKSVEENCFDERNSILICTHAASFIAIGRALTGRMPKDNSEEDFKTYTCGISKFTRRVMPLSVQSCKPVGAGEKIPKIDWENGKGVAGGWDCTVNGDCSHLEGGEERNWHFQGDEDFEPLEKEASAKL